jgi:filamentous hemagglutinin
VTLNPALPTPLAGLDYEPTILNSTNPNIANSQLNGYVAELNLANQVAELPGQTVVAYGDAVGTHGADVVSVDASGNVTLWDSKFRSSSQSIQSSPTFTPGSDAVNNAVNQAVSAIENSNLPQSTINNALQNLQDGNFTANTVGSGSVKNSVQVKFCGGKPC